MRIGIDIDDTITNTWDEIIPYYSVFFNIPMEELKKGKPYYNPVKYHYTKDEFTKLLKERNKRVELDKKWETSITRRICIMIITYLVVIVYTYLIREYNYIYF